MPGITEAHLGSDLGTLAEQTEAIGNLDCTAIMPTSTAFQRKYTSCEISASSSNEYRNILITFLLSTTNEDLAAETPMGITFQGVNRLLIYMSSLFRLT